MSTIKINFKQLKDLIYCIQRNGSMIIRDFEDCSDILSSITKDIPEFEFLKAAVKRTSDLTNDFSQYSKILVENLDDILYKQLQAEKQASQQFEELNSFDPIDYDGGNIL